MDEHLFEQRGNFGAFTRFQIFITGADPELLAQVPPRELDAVRTISWLMLGTAAWQTSLFAIIAHMMLAPAGQIRPELIAAAALVSGLILGIDSYMVMRTSWALHGLQELKRGGIDVSGGIGPRMKNFVFLTVRLMISLIIALLVGLFASIMLFSKDIKAELERNYHEQNAPLFMAAEARLDEEVLELIEARAVVNEHITAEANDIAALRRTIVDPLVDAPEYEAALKSGDASGAGEDGGRSRARRGRGILGQ